MSDWRYTEATPPRFADAPVPTQPMRHSGLGIASFVISLVVAVVIFFTIAVAAVATMRHGGQADAQSPLFILVGLVTFLFLLIALAGVVLGVAGAAQKRRKKLFAWLGLCINAFVLLATLSLMAIGYASH